MKVVAKKKVNCFHRDCWGSAGCQVPIWFCCHNKEKWLKIMIRKNKWQTEYLCELGVLVILLWLSFPLRWTCISKDISVYLQYVLFKPSATLNAWSSCSTEMIRFKKRKKNKNKTCRAPIPTKNPQSQDNQTSWCQRQHWCHAEVFPTLCP